MQGPMDMYERDCSDCTYPRQAYFQKHQAYTRGRLHVAPVATRAGFLLRVSYMGSFQSGHVQLHSAMQ